MKIQYNLLIALACLGYMGCKSTKLSQDEEDMQNPDKVYVPYKPVYYEFNGAYTMVWGKCWESRVLEKDIDKIPDYYFIPVSQQFGQVKLGYAIGHDPNLAFIRPDRRTTGYFVQAKYKNNPNKDTPQFPFEAIEKSPEYAKYRAMDCGEIVCSQATASLIKDLGDGCSNPNGSISKICQVIPESFDATQLTDPSVKNTELVCKYYNDVIFPTLKADMYSDACGGDYMFDAIKDKPDGLSKNNRYIYINVVIAPPNDTKNEYYVTFGKVGEKVQGISLKHGSVSPDTIRYCKETNNEVRYVVKFLLKSSGDYSATLYNWNSTNKTEELRPLQSINFYVNSMDNYTDVNANQTYNSTARTIAIQPLNLMLDPISFPFISRLTIDSKPNFKATVEHAFSLNEKKPVSFDNQPDLLKVGMEINILPDDFSFTKFFDKNGNIKLLKSQVLKYAPANKIIFTFSDLKDPYYRALDYTYQQIANQYWASHPNTLNTLAFYANSAILVDENWQPFNEAVDSPVDNLFTPHIVIMNGLNGYTAPSEGANNTPYLKFLSVVGIFKKGMTWMVTPGTNINSVAAVTLVHELGHAWGQNQMAWKWNSNTPSDLEIHTHYCTGYNKSRCVFNTDFNLIRQNYRDYNATGATSLGITWCESHKQIILNQLMRKFYVK